MFFDTDCGGVVSNIAYLRFIEIARTLRAEKLGARSCRNGRDATLPGGYPHGDRLSSWCQAWRSTRHRGLAGSSGTRAFLVRISHHSPEGQRADCRVPTIAGPNRDASGKVAPFTRELEEVSRPENKQAANRLRNR